MAIKGQGAAYKWLQAHIGYAGGDCLIWPFYRIKQRGYGQLGHRGQSHYAHRLMCELTHGKHPRGKPQASHSCGNGHLGCVNPRHLSWATNSENQLNRRLHGTVAIRPNRLTAAQIKKVRSMRGKKTIEAMARQFGVKRGCIEYWLRHDRPLQRPGGSPSNIRDIQRRKMTDSALKNQTPRIFNGGARRR